MAEERAVVYVVDDDVDAGAPTTRAGGPEARLFASPQEFLQSKRPELPGCPCSTQGLPGISGSRSSRSGEDRHRAWSSSPHADVPMSVRAMKAGASSSYGQQPRPGAPRRDPACDRALPRRRMAHLAALRARYEELHRARARGHEVVVTGRRTADRGRSRPPETVKVHRGQVMRKMSAKSVAEPGAHGRPARGSDRTRTKS